MVKSGKNSYKFEKSDVPRSEIFTYKAFPERIVDGDTLLVTIDLGFKTSLMQRLRFRGIDSPEKGNRENEKVEKFILRRFRSVKFIVVKTHGVDLYGRYLADVYFSEKEKEIEKVLERGNFLNNELLESGLVSVD
ncbi:MAG: thermonuclease family protein [Leptospira sp.]|nr:thermonuclease family protein [Leptospira sp.]